MESKPCAFQRSRPCSSSGAHCFQPRSVSFTFCFFGSGIESNLSLFHPLQCIFKSVRSQILGQMRCLFKYQQGLRAWFSPHCLVPTWYSLWLGISTLYPESAPEVTFWLPLPPLPLLTFCPLGCCTQFPSLPSPQMAQSNHVHSGLTQMSLPLCAPLCL